MLDQPGSQALIHAIRNQNPETRAKAQHALALITELRMPRERDQALGQIVISRSHCQFVRSQGSVLRCSKSIVTKRLRSMFNPTNALGSRSVTDHLSATVRPMQSADSVSI